MRRRCHGDEHSSTARLHAEAPVFAQIVLVEYELIESACLSPRLQFLKALVGVTDMSEWEAKQPRNHMAAPRAMVEPLR
jgi:hypothetical protein